MKLKQVNQEESSQDLPFAELRVHELTTLILNVEILYDFH
jgi:hypothetical protein